MAEIAWLSPALIISMTRS